MTRISLRQFRTYERFDISLPTGTVVIAGPNGVGKTNFLEACAMLMQGASPRTSSELRCIRQGSHFMRIAGTISVGGGVQERAVTIEAGRGKRLERDSVIMRSVADYTAGPPLAVTFLPERLLVVRGAPARRRALLDALVEQLQPGAAGVLRAYAHVVSQRNALLRQARQGRNVGAQLGPWNEQLERTGAELRRLRARTIAELSPRLTERFEQLTGLKDAAVSVELRGADIARGLAETADSEHRRAATMVGPHLDEVRFLQNDRDLRSFGSTGEQRSALLAWALASADALRARNNAQPALILDEPYAELDHDRRARLSAVLAQLGQVLVTTTEPPEHLQRAPQPSPVSILQVFSGTISPWTTPRENSR